MAESSQDPSSSSLSGSAQPSTRPKGWQPPSTEELQQLLPQYEITALLGRGGMGAVYKGTQKNLDRPVAIKILPPGMDDENSGARFSERFKNEARAMARLSHVGIVAVYDSGETADGLLYIVMEFVEGTDVQKMVSQQGRLHTEHAMAITAHVCDALQYAHDRGIIHRDIKPANIMVGYDGAVKVADFGLAKMERAGESGLTRSGMAMGTLHYMAPEALMLGTSVDHRADIYAVGVMLYYMLTGKLPQGMFKLPSLLVPGLDPRYDGIITKALRDDRELRYQSAAELRMDLDGILTQPVVKVSPEAKQAPAALPTEARPQRPRQPSHPQFEAPIKKQGSPFLWALVCVLGGTLAWMIMDRQPSNAPQSLTSTVLPEPSTPAAPGPDTQAAQAEVPMTSNAVPGTQPVPKASDPAPVSLSQSSASAAWRDLLKDKPELIKLLKITDSTNAGWKIMQRGFAPVLNEKNVALRLKARSHSLRLVARWSETADNGTHGHTLRIGPGTDGKTRMFGGWIKTIDTNQDGVIEPRMYNSTGPSALGPSPLFEVPEGQEYEIEQRSYESRLEVLVDGKVMKDVRGIGLPGQVIALHPFKPFEFKDLEWRPLPPDPVTTAASQPQTAPAPPPSAASSTVPALKPGVWHDLIKENLVATNGLTPEPAGDGSGKTLYLAKALFMPQSTLVFRDCALRVKFGACQWKIAPWVMMRRNERRDYVSCTWVDNDAVLRHHHPPISAWTTFGKKEMGSALSGSQPFVLELKAVGDQYTFSKDGRMLVEGRYSGCDQGTVGLRLDPGTVIESFEVMVLDGLSGQEIDAALLAGKTAGEAESPTPQDTGSMKLLVDASFEQPVSGFPDSRNKNIAAEWKDGSYRLSSLSNAIWWPGIPALQKLRVHDFVCEVEARVPQQAEGSWGIGLIPPSGSGIPWIGAKLNAAGQAEIYRYNSSNSASLAPLAVTNATPAGGAWNKVRIEAAGSRFRLFVNDRFVAEAATSERPPPNALTLFLHTPRPGLEAWFRNVRVWETAGGTAAATVAPPTPTAPVIASAGMTHTWTDSQGRKIAAEFVRADATTLIVRMQGKELPVSLASLSAESRQLAAFLAGAPKTGSFTNSLGMVFVPVPGAKVLFCAHETRHRDYAAYAADNRNINTAWQNQSYAGHPITSRGTDHPVTKLTVAQAMQFCEWLNQKEGRKYRLPTNEEWTLAAQGADSEFPWGRAWPPPPNAGNYSDESYHQLRPTDPYLKGYDDRFPTTAPVMSFPPNALGIHDLGGNVWEWVHTGDPAVATSQNNPPMVQRGASFLHDSRDFLRSRKEAPATSTVPDAGFRVVVEPMPLSAPSAIVPSQMSAPVATPAIFTPSQASKDAPFINTLGMKFVPVPGTRVLMSIYETRVQDFRAFVKATDFDYKKGPITIYGGREEPALDWERQTPSMKEPIGDDHPVQHVSWEDAQAFNEWLTRHEQDAGRLPPGHSYRLPTESEWSAALGAGPYGWGAEWPPPTMSGNFTNNAAKTEDVIPPPSWDTFFHTSPVGSFNPNSFGLYDLDGNASEFGQEVTLQSGARMVGARGSSFASRRDPNSLNKSYRSSLSSSHRRICPGFRCVLEFPASAP